MRLSKMHFTTPSPSFLLIRREFLWHADVEQSEKVVEEAHQQRRQSANKVQAFLYRSATSGQNSSADQQINQ